MIINDLCKYSKEELYEKLTTTYQNQKLGTLGNIIARSIAIAVLVLAVQSSDGMIYKIFGGIGIAFSAYKIIKPHGEDEEIFSELKEVVNLLENYKKCKDGIATIDITDKQFQNATRNIEKRLPKLLENSTFNKVLAFIPIFNIFVDELGTYRGRKNSGHLECLLDNGIGRVGLRVFTDENIKIKDTKENN